MTQLRGKGLTQTSLTFDPYMTNRKIRLPLCSYHFDQSALSSDICLILPNIENVDGSTMMARQASQSNIFLIFLYTLLQPLASGKTSEFQI